MNCPECLELLQQHLDGTGLTDRAALDAHLAGCPDCQEWFAAARRLEEGLRIRTFPLSPANLTGRVLSAVLSQQRRLRLRRWLVVGAAAAAAIVVAILAGFPGPREPASGPGHQVRQPLVKLEEKGPAVPELPAAPSLGQSVKEARFAVAALTDDLASHTRTQARLLWNIATPLDRSSTAALAAVGELEQPLEPAAQSLRESGRSVSVSLAAVTGSARRAVTYFLRELPPLQN